MNKNIPISTVISRKVLLVFIASTFVQLLLLASVMIYLSYHDAKSRANFLVNSNSKALGLMISTGDLFQLKSTLNSYRSEKTPFVWMLDENDESITRAVDTLSDSLPKRLLSFNRDGLLLVTSHVIEYNNQKVGRLLLANRIFLSDWAILFLMLLTGATATFFIQGKILERSSLEIGASIKELGTFYEVSKKESDLEYFYLNRKKTRISEIEDLATQIKNMLIALVRSSSLERDAAIGRISAQLTHDMRAPIGTFERLLLTPDHELPNLKSAVKESVLRLYNMVDSLRHGELENIVRTSIKTLDFRVGHQMLLAKAKLLSKDFSIPLDPINDLHIDEPKLERAWINLASNALEFARTKAVVEAKIIKNDLIIRVLDDGPGVAEEVLPRLFQRGVTFGKSEGSGLGLAYVKQIMHGHGGDVRYYRDNELSVFECLLPGAVAANLRSPSSMSTNEVIIGEKSLLSSQKTNTFRRVAICLSPETFNTRVIHALQSCYSTKYEFSQDRETSDIIVSNIDDIMFEVLEEDKQEFIQVSPTWGGEDQVISLLKRRFEVILPIPDKATEVLED